MDLTDLRFFSAVAREGSVTRAAEKLHRVQSNVTTRVRQLEDELGVELFIRAGKRLHLAPAGRVLLGYAERLLALAEEAAEAVQDARPRGLFRLGSNESTAAVRLPCPLSEYHRRHPEVKLELKTGTPRQLATLVLAGELDAALAAEPIPDAHFDMIPAYEEELVLVARAGHPPIGPGLPMPRTILAFEHGCPHRSRLEKWFADQGLLPERIVEITSYHAMLGCIVAGMGVALLPRMVLSTFPESRRLSIHPLPKGQNRLQTVLFWRKGGRSPNLDALIDVLKEVQGQDRTVADCGAAPGQEEEMAGAA